MSSADYGKDRERLIRRNRERREATQPPSCECGHAMNEHRMTGACMAVGSGRVCPCSEFRQTPITPISSTEAT